MATVGYLYLFLTFTGLLLAQRYPDNRGTEFVVGYMANYKLEFPPELFVTTSKTTAVNVTVTAPMFPDAGLNEVFTVTKGEVQQIFINNTIRAVGTAKESKGIVVKASDEVVVYGTNVEQYSNDAFLAFPVDVLGNDYYTVSHYPSTMECEFMLVGVYDSTNVNITLGTHFAIDVEYNGEHYYNRSIISVSLDRLETFQVQTFGDLTGTHVYSDRDVVVFSGNKFTNVHGNSRDHLVDQMLPVHTWGRLFVTVPIPYRLVFKSGLKYHMGDTNFSTDQAHELSYMQNWPSAEAIDRRNCSIESCCQPYSSDVDCILCPQALDGTGDEMKFIASEDNTFVQVNCSLGYNVSFTIDAGTYTQYILPSDECCAINATGPIMVILIVLSQADKSEPADPSLITIPPVEQYADEYILATPKYSMGEYQNFVMFIVKDDVKDGFLIDGSPVPSDTAYTAVPGTDYVGGFVEVSDGTHDFRHSGSSVFGLFMYGTAKWETYGMPGGLSLSHINGWCDLSFTPVDGDGIDNDCDDLIDEEDCSPENMGVDDDGDGYVDEDCALPPPIDGNWTQWSSWSSCSISCTPLGENMTSGIATRNRSCENPEPEYGGYVCIGHDVETMPCTESTTCPVHGNWSSWEPWGACSVTCDNGTHTRNRTCSNPTPDYGGDGCSGSANETGICETGVPCPIDGAWGSWGAWSGCTVTCGNGSSVRTRACDSPAPAHGGADCGGDNNETVTCNDFSCPINGGWSAWSAWSSCGVTCGNSTALRNRSCTDPVPQYNGTDCSGADSEEQQCYSGTMCPIDGGFSGWSSWDACTASCNGGTRNRTRSCSNPAPQYLGADCDGHTDEQQDCNTHSCPIDGNWTVWSEWGFCSSICGQGIATRERSCSNPVPRYNGSDCVGDVAQVTVCNGTCSVDGGWGAWDSWAACSVTCGTGHRARVRICDSPSPTPDGSPCFGVAILSESCHENACVGSGTWNPYGKFVNKCPQRYFACKDGGISCVEQTFRCDCVSDCDDGSDESVDWAMCSRNLFTYCEQNSARGIMASVLPYLCVFVTLVIWNMVT